MLSSPERPGKFEQLRALWEAADTSESSKMVGRRVKPAPEAGVRNELQQNPGSKFRRKLSNGLALISLTQRKTVSGRQSSSNALLAVSAPSTNDSSTTILDRDLPLSLGGDATSATTSSDRPPQEIAQASEDLQTPRALPRSRTFSYIPRAVKLDTESSHVTKRDEPIDTSLDTATRDSKPAPPSRIPTPSPPPQLKRRVWSPCQYAPGNLQSAQARIAKNCQSFTTVATGSPSEAAVRSRTTSNLVNTSTPLSASFMAPRRTGPKRPFASSTPQNPVLAENVPMSKRGAQRQLQVQERFMKRESMAVASSAANRRSLGPGGLTAQNVRAGLAPSESAKRLSAHLLQTPVTAKRVSTRAPQSLHKPPSPCPEETPLTNVPDLASANSSTPTLSTVDLLDLPLAPPPKIRAYANSNAQKRTSRTPNGLASALRSSKLFAAANYQVRGLPRSSTFHHFGGRSEAPPPVPPVPDHYRLPSFPKLVKPLLEQEPARERPDSRHRLPATLAKWEPSNRSLSSNVVSTQMSREDASINSMSTSVSRAISEVPESADNACLTDQANTLYRFKDEDGGRSIELNNVQPGSPSKLSGDTTALPALRAKPDLNAARVSASTSLSDKLTGDLAKYRRWSISLQFYPNCADEDTCVQVRDYMPPLYWAGRFQSRFDRWRTEAMTAQLNPELEPEDDGLLGQCSIEDEGKAIVLIFMQLRDLCASSQAADSLHVSVLSSTTDIDND